MARHKEFDRTDVVDKAVDVFWSKGYEATSIQDLVDAMGINRGSIYATFGDKAGLFEAALNQYFPATLAQRLIESADLGDPRQTLEAFFDELVNHATAPGGRRGCLVTSTLNELCASNDKLAIMVGDRLRAFEGAFEILIRRGQATGVFASGKQPRPLARSLIATVQGIQSVAKLSPGFETIRDIADVALANLD
jgi:TetR/AcrR family transcriptional regulator, transcriptional repressor for nem operon